MQEGVAVEIAEAVAGALAGELSATAVNAPMVPTEVSGSASCFPFFVFDMCIWPAYVAERSSFNLCKL